MVAGRSGAQAPPWPADAAGYSVEKVELLLSVPSIEEAAEWYERVLGCEVRLLVFDGEWGQGRCTYASVHFPSTGEDFPDTPPLRGFNLATLGISPGTYGRTGRDFVITVSVDDVDAVYRRAVAHGGQVHRPPRDEPWGGRAFSMADLNGFTLAFVRHPGARPADPPG
jgi:uncharacterized glyoxalase superfamily protein PhnB